jgi:hypothetical protein
MHLFFNDPRARYVTRHRRLGRPSLAGLVVGGVGVAALGVLVGSAAYDQTGAPSGGGESMALPVATPRRGIVEAGGPLGMGTVPAAPVPVLEFREDRTLAVPNADKSGNATVSRLESSAVVPPPGVNRGPTAMPSVDPTNTINPTWTPAPSEPPQPPIVSEPAPQPQPTDDAPAATDEAPAATDKAPAATSEAPAATGEVPATSEVPAVKDEGPAGMDQGPADAGQTLDDRQTGRDDQGDGRGRHRWDHRTRRTFWDGR